MTDAAPTTVEKPSDFGSDAGAECRRWLAEIREAETGKDLQGWLKKCDTVEKDYIKRESLAQGSRYAMLYANIETIKPAVYARTPKPVVVARHKDRDPVARAAAEVLERSLAYMIDSYDFDGRMKAARDDYVMFARGVLWLRYAPRIDGDSVAGEQVVCDFIDRRDFLHNPARHWQELRWGSRRVYKTRAELVERFGKELGNKVTLDHEITEASTDDGPSDLYKKATVYEIWDKNSLSVIWVAKSYKDQVLDKRKDPLHLRDFFPFPLPALGTTTTGSLIPTPDYVYYMDQAVEIDKLTARISTLSDALRMVGWYAADEKSSLSRVFQAKDNQMIPVENWAVIGDKGGIKGLVEWVPIDMVSATLTGCIELRKQIIEDIYQITGISDIVRGASDPRETLGAQQIKTQWGGLRIRDRQAELQRLARDIVRLKGEIISELFGQDTLAAMSGIKLPTRADQQMARMKLMVAMVGQQQAQDQGPTPEQLRMGMPAEPPQQGVPTAAPGAPARGDTPQQAPPQPMPQQAPPPQADIEQLTQLLESPSWEDVMELLRDDPHRRFVIDIETDSTIQANEQEEKQSRIECIQATGAFLQQAGPIALQAPELTPMLSEMMLFLFRTFRAGRSMEESIEQGMQSLQKRAMAALSAPAPGEQPDPAKMAEVQRKMQKDQTDAALAKAKLQIEGVKQQGATQMHQQKLQADMAKAQMVHQVNQAKLGIDAGAQQADTAVAGQDLALAGMQTHIAAFKAETERAKAMADAHLQHAALAMQDQHHAQDAQLQDAHHRQDAQLQATQHEADSKLKAKQMAQKPKGAAK